MGTQIYIYVYVYTYTQINRYLLIIVMGSTQVHIKNTDVGIFSMCILYIIVITEAMLLTEITDERSKRKK